VLRCGGELQILSPVWLISEATQMRQRRPSSRARGATGRFKLAARHPETA
jgi:hypothetical protein